MKLGLSLNTSKYLKEPLYIRQSRKVLQELENRIELDGNILETYPEHKHELERLAKLGLLDSLSLGYIAGAYGTGKWYNIKGAEGDLGVVRATNGTRQNRSGLIDTLGNNLTRADFEDGVLKGNWVESAATNLFLHSENFANPVWAKVQTGTGLLPVVTSAVSVIGDLVFDRIVFDLNAGNTLSDRSIIRRSVGTVDTPFGMSFYIKSNTSSSYTLRFHLSGGDVQDIFVTPKLKRHILLNTSNASSTLHGIELRGSRSSGYADILISGGQFENNKTSVSTYIKTTTTTATRNADNISKTGIASEIGQTEGTLMVKMIALRQKTVTSRIIQINDGTTNNRLLVWIGADGLMRAGASIGGVFTQWFVLSSIITGDVDVAISYKSGDTRLCVNGVNTGVYDTPFTLNTMSQINIGHQLGANQLNDTVYSAYVWKTAKTAAELIALTTL